MARLTQIVALLFALCLINGAFATKKRLRKLQGNQVMGMRLKQIAKANMDDDSYHGLVEMKAPKDDMLKALDELQTKIRSEQESEQAAHDQDVAAQSAAIANHENELADEKEKLSNAEAEIKSLEGQITATKNEIEGLENDIQEEEGKISRAKKERDDAVSARAARAKDHSEIIKQHENSISSLDVIIGMVREFNFEDASEKLVELQSKLPGDAAKLVASTQETLQELKDAAPGDVEGKNKIKARLLKQLETIQEEVRRSKTLYERDEAKSIEAHNTYLSDVASLIASYESAIESLKGHISEAESHLASLEKSLESEKNKVKSAKEAIEALEKLIADAKAELQNTKDQFKAETADRNGDLNALEKARTYIIENIHGMTVADTCHVEAPDCPRCLYDKHCKEGEGCNADGHCEDARVACVEKNNICATYTDENGNAQSPSKIAVHETEDVKDFYGFSHPQSGLRETNVAKSLSLYVIKQTTDNTLHVAITTNKANHDESVAGKARFTVYSYGNVEIEHTDSEGGDSVEKAVCSTVQAPFDLTCREGHSSFAADHPPTEARQQCSQEFRYTWIKKYDDGLLYTTEQFDSTIKVDVAHTTEEVDTIAIVNSDTNVEKVSTKGSLHLHRC